MELLLFPILMGAYLIVSNTYDSSISPDAYLLDTATDPFTPQHISESASDEALSLTERIGLTAGQIWHYLAEHEAAPISDLLKAIDEEERIVLFSIGWLAREEKICVQRLNNIDLIALRN